MTNRENRVDAKAIIGAELTPARDGATLGRHIIEAGLVLDDLIIDVTDLAPEDIVSTFVNAFLHELELGGRDIAGAGGIHWKAKFPSEADRLGELVSYYVQDSTAKQA